MLRVQHRDIISSDTAHHCPFQTVLMNSKQGNSYYFSSFPWVGVHAFEFNALQVTLSFVYTTLQEMLDMVAFG